MNLLKKILIKLKQFFSSYNKKSVYIKTNPYSDKWIYISYISDIFYHLNDQTQLDVHQNRREAIKIAEIFYNLGFNLYIQNYNSRRKIPNLDFKIIFGIEPNFCNACYKHPNAIKIYYATGAYFEHQNKQVRAMTDYINRTYKINMSYQRLVKPHDSIKIADYILQIGSKYTINTYPEEFKPKIELIKQSSQATCDTNTKEYAPENEYFCIASSGNALKGIILLIEFFHAHPQYTINIVGPIDNTFYKGIKNKLSTNIKLWGFLNINGTTLKTIMSHCNFIIYPSGSEGGVPGAVLNAMKRGLIPIVTPWAAFNEINEYGYLMNEWNAKSISNGINWSLKLSPEQIKCLSSKCISFVNNNFTLEVFSNEFKTYINNIITKNNVTRNIY